MRTRAYIVKFVDLVIFTEFFHSTHVAILKRRIFEKLNFSIFENCFEQLGS